MLISCGDDYRAQEEEEEAALRLANDQLFVSAAAQRTPNFSNQTTTFLEKETDLHVPTNFV